VGGIAVPVLLLFLQSMSRAVMAIVAVTFVFFFCVSVSVVTGARVQDMMFGTAAWVHLPKDSRINADLIQVLCYCHYVLRKLVSRFGREMRVLRIGGVKEEDRSGTSRSRDIEGFKSFRLLRR
jgi:hypothetical protein